MHLGCSPFRLGSHPSEAYCWEGRNQDASDSCQSSAVAFEASSGSTNLALPSGVAWAVVAGSLAIALASMEAEEVMVEVLVDEEACVLVVAAEACLEVVA